MGNKNLILAEEIKDSLETEIIGKKVYYYSQVNSTNKIASELAAYGANEGTVVIAERQVSGRGRRGRVWHSSDKGLWFSVILRPEIKISESHFLIINASLAVYYALKSYGIETEIKWPNDILYKNKKVCGILSEMNSSSGNLNYIVTGIGINVNQKKFPDELKDKAVSLYNIQGAKIDKFELLTDILFYFENFYFKFLNGENEKLLEEWKSKISLLGKEIIVKSDGKEYFGKAVDIAKDGRLILLTNKSETKKFWAGDTSIRK
ncbi:MAG: biotin--[acetyl-CoA-carboxylase] ligase [Bacillota bacterium]